MISVILLQLYSLTQLPPYSILTAYGWGAAVYVNYGENVSVSACRFDGNKASGGDGSGGALFVSFSSSINIVDTSFTNNTALDAGGEGGALAIYHVKNTLIKDLAVQFLSAIRTKISTYLQTDFKVVRALLLVERWQFPTSTL